MEIKKTKNGNELIFAIQGRLDTTTAPQFEAELKQNIDGAETLILDLVDLEYLSSAGLRHHLLPPERLRPSWQPQSMLLFSDDR